MSCKTTKIRQQMRNVSTTAERFSTGSSDPCADPDATLNIAEIGVNLTDETIEIGVTAGIRQIASLEGNAANDGKAPIWNDATKKYIPGTVGGGGGTYANVLFVSASGNNVTAMIGDISKPYLNIVNAVAAASSGDTIYQIGNQTISTGNGNLAKDGVKYVIQGDLTSTLNTSLFDDSAGAVVVDIFCTGTIRLQDPLLTSSIYKISHVDSLFKINVNLSHADSMVSTVTNGEMIHYGTIEGEQKNLVLVTDAGQWYHEGLCIHNSLDGSNDDFAIAMIDGVGGVISQKGDLVTLTKGDTTMDIGVIGLVNSDKPSRFSFDGDIHCNGTGNNGSDSHLIYISEAGQFNFTGSIYANNLPSILWFQNLDIGANIHLKMSRWECLGDDMYTRGVFEDLAGHTDEEDVSVIIDGNGFVTNGIFARLGNADGSFPIILKGRVVLEIDDNSAHGIVLLDDDVTFDGMTLFMPTGSAARSVKTFDGTSKNIRIYGGGFQSNNIDENSDNPGVITTQVFPNHYVVGDGSVQ